MAAEVWAGSGFAFAGRCVGRHLDDAVTLIHPDDVEADLAVVHPVRVLPRLVVNEEYAATLRQRGAFHKAKLSLGFGFGQLYMHGRSIRQHDEGVGGARRDLGDLRFLRAGGKSGRGERDAQQPCQRFASHVKHHPSSFNTSRVISSCCGAPAVNRSAASNRSRRISQAGLYFTRSAASISRSSLHSSSSWVMASLIP